MVISIDKDFELIDQIENEWSVLKRYAPNLLYVEYKDGDDDLDLDFAKAQVKCVNELCEGIPHHIILDFTQTSVNFSPEAREYFAENESHNQLRLSQAIIIKSLAHKLVANFYMRFNKPKGPTVIVNSKEQAVKWIKNHL